MVGTTQGEPRAWPLPYEELLRTTGIDEDGSELTDACRHILASGGKQLRPRLVLAAARLAGDPGAPAVRRAATAVELFHCASLAHDDVIDDSSLRRGRRTVGSLYGNRAAGLAGGWLCGRAGALMADCGRGAMERLAAAACRVCEGQMLEVCDAYDTGRSRERYLEAIGDKTATLFQLAVALGAELAGADDEAVRDVEEFGWSLGLAFQILDDLWDLLLDEQVTGKPRGQDLLHGVYTLPVLCAIEEDRSIEEALGDVGMADEVGPVVAAICATDGPARAARVARDHVAQARDAVAGRSGAAELLRLLDDEVAAPLKAVA